MNNPKNNAKNIIWHEGFITKNDRERLLGQDAKVFWFTGLSGSGKSTIAVSFERELYKMGILTYRLDGDNIRHGLNSDLGFSAEDRRENIRRIAEVSKLFYDAGLVVLVSFISPHREMRDFARSLIHQGDFIEVYVKADLDTCIRRDPKGLYKKALNGEIKEFTGISSPYEAPLNPELVLDTEKSNVKQCVDLLMQFIKSDKS